MRWLSLAVAAALLAGCGYVGDPLPPALNIPEAVRDLRVIQRGDKLVLDYTAPSLTTEQLGITSFGSAEAAVGDQTIPVNVPKPGESGHAELPAASWTDKEIVVRIRLAGPKGKQSAPSNAVAVDVVRPLPAPLDVVAAPHPEGIRVSWKPGDDRVTRYRVVRTPDANGEADRTEYVDHAVELGKEYKYSVVAVLGKAESLPSTIVTTTAKDEFAPTVPSGLTAIAGIGSIELAWERNTEADFKSYRVYRDGQLLDSEIQAPAYSDRKIEAKKQYRYEITAVDQFGNESAKSPVIEITAP